MPDALPVTGVSAGDNLRLGSPSVANVAATVAPEGFNAGKVSLQNAVYFDGQTGATVYFAFDQPYTLPTTLNVPFTFGGDSPITGVAIGDQTRFGGATATKAAKDAFPDGWDSAAVSGPRVWAYVDNGGAAVDFSFTLTYTQPSQLNTPFYFGGSPVVTGVTLGDQLRFGSAQEVRATLQLLFSSFGGSALGRPRVGVTGSIDFLFTVTYDTPATLNVPFYFGSGLVVAAIGSDVSKFGAATASKVAQDLTPVSIDNLQVGRPTTFFDGQNGAGRDFKFESPYFTPPTLNVPFYFLSLPIAGPTGWTSSIVNDGLFVRNAREVAYPTGWTSSTVSTGTDVVNDIEFAVDLAALGINQFGAGTPTVIRAEQFVDLTNYGISPGGTGAPTVGVPAAPPSLQTLPLEGFDASLYGDARVESTIRYVTLSSGFNSTAYGTPTTWFRVRSVGPSGIAYAFSWEQIGSPIVWEGTRYVSPLGHEDSKFGTTTARRNEFIVEPAGLTGEFGATDVQYGLRFVGPREFIEAFAPGTPEVYNSRQYVTQLFTTDNVPYLGGFGTYTWVYNRNFTIAPFAWVSSRYSSGAAVYNNARLVGPEGLDATLWGDQLVADRIRYVGAQGFEELNNFRWIVAYNLSQIVEPSGVPRPYAGIPYVWSNTQWVDLFGSNNFHLQWGADTFVAPAIRYITFTRENGIENFSIGPLSRVGTHYTGLFQQYVEPQDINTGRVGDHVFEERFTIFKPWGQDFSEFGEPLVKNNTPQLFPIGPEPLPFPAPMLGFTRIIDYTGKSIVPPWPTFPWWNTVVAFRTKVVTPQGIQSLVMPRPDVRLDAPELPVPVTIQTYGILPPYNGVPYPTIRRHPSPEGWLSQIFGTASVRVQGCKTLWDFPSSVFGLPSLNPPRRISNVTLGGPLATHGKHRITPHTIYCTPELTEQALINNGPEVWGYIDSGLPDRYGPDIQWGTPFVTTPSTQIVYAQHGGTSPPDTTVGNLFGGAELVENKIRTVYVDGTRFTKYGYPTLPYVQELFATPWLSQAFGATEISRGELLPFTITLSVNGINAGLFGATYVELLNRDLPTTGFVATLFGNNNPMVYHYPRGPKNTGGSVLSQYGTPTVEFAIRYVYPAGYESFTMDYELLYFNERLKVYKLNHPTSPAGQDQSQFGSTGVRLGMQIVSPYMIEAPRCLGHDVTVST